MTFKERLASLGFPTYAEYLASPTWEAFKERYRQSSRPQLCLVCKHSHVDLHHHDYSRIGHERFGDVDPLCRKHHEEVHRILKENFWAVSRTDAALKIIGMPKTPQTPTQPKMSQTEAILQITELQGRGIRHQLIPLDYSPVAGCPNLFRFLKLLLRSLHKGNPPIIPVKPTKKKIKAKFQKTLKLPGRPNKQKRFKEDISDPMVAMRAIAAGLRI